MSDATIFVLVFVGLFVLRIIFATIVFFWILPQTDRCPECNAVTLRLEPTGVRRAFPWFRYSWCLRCGWRGLLRSGSDAPPPEPSVERETSSEAPRSSYAATRRPEG